MHAYGALSHLIKSFSLPAVNTPQAVQSRTKVARTWLQPCALRYTPVATSPTMSSRMLKIWPKLGLSLGFSLRHAFMVSTYVSGVLAGRLGYCGCATKPWSRPCESSNVELPVSGPPLYRPMQQLLHVYCHDFHAAGPHRLGACTCLSDSCLIADAPGAAATQRRIALYASAVSVIRELNPKVVRT